MSSQPTWLDKLRDRSKGGGEFASFIGLRDRLALHRWHWMFVLVGTIPMLFGDVFFFFDASTQTVLVNRIIFIPSLGYGFAILACCCLVFLEGRKHSVRILSAVHLILGAVLAFSDSFQHQAILVYAYLTSCAVSLAPFVLYGRVSSSRFAVFCAIMLLLPFVLPFLTFARVAVSILLILLLRLAVVFVEENTNFFVTLGWRRSATLALWTALYW